MRRADLIKQMILRLKMRFGFWLVDIGVIDEVMVKWDLSDRGCSSKQRIKKVGWMTHKGMKWISRR
ncbi:MAG: hypothetical protein DRJ47_06070 [Thermoprotei archaeon]|nr:MAG: hypothetical protein DRJ47_06070 [Thermoprotei archaeon]